MPVAPSLTAMLLSFKTTGDKFWSKHFSLIRPFTFLMQLKLNIIVAACESRGIGFKGDLPWRLKAEMNYFTRMTSTVQDSSKKNAVVMGRKTWDSIPLKYRPLSNRLNIVLSKTITDLGDEAVVFITLNQAIEALSTLPLSKEIESVWVIGGSSIYQEALNSPNCYRVYYTDIKKDFQCDTFFPKLPSKFDLTRWMTIVLVAGLVGQLTQAAGLKLPHDHLRQNNENDVDGVEAAEAEEVEEVEAEDEVGTVPPSLPATSTSAPAPSGRPCTCKNGKCSCCTGIILQNLNFPIPKLCGEILYEPEDFTFNFLVNFNERNVYKTKVSGKNPRPICLPLSRFLPVDMCVKFSNIYMIGRNIHACVAMEGHFLETELFDISFECIRLGANGVALLKPEEGGGLSSIVQESPSSTDLDYDDSA